MSKFITHTDNFICFNYTTNDDPLLENFTYIEDLKYQILNFKMKICPFKLRQKMLQDEYLSQFVDNFDFENITKNFIFHEEIGGHQPFKIHANKMAIGFKLYSKVMDLIAQQKIELNIS